MTDISIAALDEPTTDLQVAEAPRNEYLDLVQQPAASPVQPAANPYVDILRQGDAERETRLRATALGTQGSSPDVAAKALALSRKTGLPVDMVERNLPEVETKQKANEYADLLKRAPKMADWLAQDPVNAKVMPQDDVEKLGFVEWTVNELYRPYLSQQASSNLAGVKVATRRLSELEAALGRQNRGEYLSPFDKEMIRQEPEIRDAMRGFIIQYGMQREEKLQAAAALPELPVIKEMQKAGEAGDWGGVFSALMKDPVRAAYVIALQGSAMLPWQIAGYAAGGIPGVFATSFGLEYMGAVEDALKQSGVNTQDPTQIVAAFGDADLMAKVERQAATKASVIGAFDAASMRLARVPLGVGRTAVTRTATDIGSQMLVQGAMGGAGEALGSVAAGMKVDPFAVVSEVIGEFGSGPAEVVGARWGQAVRQDATARELEQFRALSPLAKIAVGQAMMVDRLIEQVTNTKIASLSPEKLQDFISSVTDTAQSVFVPASTLASYLQDMTGLQAQEFVDRLGIAEQIERARVTGEDIAIPLSTYIVNASEAHKAWREDIRTEVDGFSVKQAQEWEKAKASELKALQDRFEEHVRSGMPPDPQGVVYQQVLEMAKANGYTNDVAAQHAALYAARYAARAARNPNLYADALDAFEKAGSGKGMRIQTMLADGTRVMGPDVLDTMLDSLRSGKDPVRLPKMAKPAKPVGSAQDASILKAARRLARGLTPEKPVKKPQSLTEFVRKAGGLNILASEAGDIRAADLAKIPGLLQKKGKGKGQSADILAQAAMDAGFRFGPETQYGSGVDVDAFIKALEADATGRSKVYPDDADTAAFQAQQEYFDEFFRWLKDDLGWEPKGRTPEEIADFLRKDDTTQRLMVLAERVEALGPDSEEAMHLDRELQRIADESLERLADEYAERDAAMMADVDEADPEADTASLALDEWERLHDDIQATLDPAEPLVGGIGEGGSSGRGAQGTGGDPAGDGPAPQNPREAARARRDQALKKFQADRRQLADVLDSLGLDIAKMSNAQIRAVLEREIGGRTLNQPVYHGSPHIFDKFTLDKIGTGEGAQAYGWGLYFAGNKAVAKYYREALSNKEIAYKGVSVHAIRNLAVRSAVESVRHYIKTEGLEPAAAIKKAADLATTDRLRENIEALKAGDIKVNDGRLYHVEIPDDGAYLNWDKPLSEQSPEVRKALEKLGIKPAKLPTIRDPLLRNIVKRAMAADEGKVSEIALTVNNDAMLYKLAQQAAGAKRLEQRDMSPGEWVEEQAAEFIAAAKAAQENTGEQIYRRLSGDALTEREMLQKMLRDKEASGDTRPFADIRARLGVLENPDRAASLALRDAGIPGIQYLDAGSRSQGEGHHNYVLFDDALIAIQQYEQEARGQITFGDNAAIIQLFQTRDLSTLAHESGHLWLEELAFDVKHVGAGEQAKADWQTVLDFVGSTDGYITREQHELFARAFETYLMEGKAPSEGLRGVFRQFRNWLVSIYRNLRNLQAPISPEMRAVFDRLLATDEEIEGARNTQGLNPVFKDAKSADMTEAEFAAYTKRATQVVDEAEQRVLDKVMVSIRRERTKEVAKEKARIRAEVTDEMMAEPGQAALHLLRKGKLYSGETPEVLTGAKLSRNALVEMLGEAGLANLPPGIFAEEGIDPEVLAQAVGLGNGVELVDRLMQIQAEQNAMRAKGDNRSMLAARIAEETQKRLTDTLGDPLNDGSIEAEAMAAVHSDKQGALMSTELKVLARKAKQSGAISLADIEDWAAQTIAGMSVYQATQHAKYQRAERMAGQKVQRALIKGDFVAAFKAKQDQMVNFALYREAKKAADDVDGIRKLADRYGSAATIKSMDQGALEQIHQVLEEYDFKKRSGSLLAERTTFSMWAAEQAAAGFEVIEPPRLKGAGLRHYSQMTVEEIRGVGDTIKQIAHIGRWKQSMIDAGKKRDFEALVNEAVETIERQPQRGVSQMRRGTSRLQDVLGDVGSWFRSVDSALLKMETMFEWLDGDKTGRGVFGRFFRRVADAQVKERDLQKDLATKQKAIFDKVPREQTALWGTQHVVEELGGIKLNKSQMIAVALNMGNASNMQKMLQGEKWSEEAVRAMLDKHLTAEEWQFVQSTWDLIDSLWPETEALEKRVNGVAPPKVEAVPVETRFGTLRGGYYPMVYDKAGDVKADRIAAMGAEGLFDPEYRRASTRAGSTNKRVEGFNAKVLLSLNVIGSHLNEVAHDLAFREVVMDGYKFLSNDKVREAIRGALGAEYEKQTLVWLKAVANEWALDRRGLEGIDKFLQTARANTAIVGMGFRISTMLSQTAGFANSVQRLGSASMLRGMRDFYRDPAGMVAVVHEKSGEMRNRANDLERDIRLALKRMEGRDSPLDNVRRFAFRGIALFDAAVSLPTWTGAYHKGLREGMSEAEAVGYADKMVRDTQGAGSVKDLSAFQRGSEAMKLLGMFYSYFNVFYNRQRSLVRDARAADSFSDYMDVVAQGFWLLVVPTLLGALLSGQGPEDDEEWWTWAARNVGFGVFAGIPWARDIANAASNEIAGKSFGGAKLSPVQGIGEGTIRLFKDAAKLVEGKETSRTSIKNTFNVVGLFTGLPLGQVGASSQFVWDALVEETQDPEGLLDWLKGLAYGPERKK
jgi:hypothetical protein